MKHVIGIIFAAMIALSACSSDEDPSNSEACKKATEELKDATEALRILEMNAPPSVCNPCTAQQAYQIERAKLVKIEADKKAAKAKACS